MLKKIIHSLFFFVTINVMAANWSSPFNVSSPSAIGTTSNAPRVAVDNNGNAVAVWAFFDNTNTVIQAAVLPFGSTTWISRNTGLPISSNLGDQFFEPDVAVDCAGNAVLVYSLDGNVSGNRVGAAILPFGATAWIPANGGFSSSFTHHIDNPRVAVDCNGNAVAVWAYGDNNTGIHVIQAATLSAGSTTWIPASSDLSQVSFTGATADFFPEVAVDANGNAVAVWTMYDISGPGSIIQAAILAFGSTTWTSRNAGLPTFISAQDAFNPSLAVDKAGNTVVVFEFNLVFSNELGIGAATLAFGATAWTPANTGLHAPSSNWDVDAPQVAVDCEGNAVAIWIFFDNSAVNGVIQAAYLPFGTTTWIPASANLSLPSSSQGPLTPALSSNIFGDFIGVWELFNNNNSSLIQAAILPSGSTTTWDATQTISGTITGTHSYSPDVSIGYNGKAVSVWSLTVTNNVQSATTQLPISSLGSIQQFSGRVLKNEFLTQTEYAHQLCWKAASTKCFTVASYRIYCGDQLVATLGGSATGVCLHNRNKGTPCYRLVAFDAQGNVIGSSTISWN